jgi:hypothetical protein
VEHALDLAYGVGSDALEVGELVDCQRAEVAQRFDAVSPERVRDASSQAEGIDGQVVGVRWAVIHAVVSSSR